MSDPEWEAELAADQAAIVAAAAAERAEHPAKVNGSHAAPAVPKLAVTALARPEDWHQEYPNQRLAEVRALSFAEVGFYARLRWLAPSVPGCAIGPDRLTLAQLGARLRDWNRYLPALIRAGLCAPAKFGGVESEKVICTDQAPVVERSLARICHSAKGGHERQARARKSNNTSQASPQATPRTNAPANASGAAEQRREENLPLVPQGFSLEGNRLPGETALHHIQRFTLLDWLTFPAGNGAPVRLKSRFQRRWSESDGPAPGQPGCTFAPELIAAALAWAEKQDGWEP